MNVGEIRISDLDNDNYLEHFGILGMHWGVRRYQNEDGTRTPEGKAREAKRYDSKSNTWKGHDARNLTDEELNRRNSRLQREKQYRDLTEPPIKKETRNILKKVLLTTAVGALTGLMAVKYKNALAKGGEWLKTDTAKKFFKHAARSAGAAWVL